MNPEIADDLIGLAMGVFALMIPIIAILCRHQLRMAKLLRQNPNQFELQNSNAVGQELNELRSLVAQQALAIDSLANAQRDLANEIRSGRFAADSKQDLGLRT